MKYTNEHDLSLIAQVFLLDDDYDYVPNTLSATSLLKSVRETVLKKRVDPTNLEIDVSSLLASKFGQALHTGIENAWLKDHESKLRLLGWTDKQIAKILINPKPEDLFDGCVPIYFERRSSKEVDGVTVTGKFDCCFNGVIRDNKSTSTYAYMNRTNDDKYVLQCSIYRWLNPDIATEDYCEIDFYFTDWSKARTSDPSYPAVRAKTIRLPLLPMDEVEAYVKRRLAQIKVNMNKPEDQIIECNHEELWIGDPVYKYFSNPTKTDGRATKNFTNPIEANAHKNAKGKGVVITQHPKAKACNYCSAATLCTQKDKLIAQGKLDYEGG